MTVSVARVELRDQAHAILRTDIIQGRLKPGERLHVGHLADRLGVSPTPVKEALSRLSAEGLVQFGSRGGAFVTRLTTTSIDEIFELRELLEQFAAERALTIVTEADLVQLSALCESIKHRVNPDGTLEFEGFANDDIAFHTMLVGLAGNQRLVQMYHELHAYTIVARAHYQLRTEAPERIVDGRMQVYEEHKAIVAALRAGDAAALRMAITKHLATVQRFARRAIALPTEAGVPESE